MAWQTDGYEEGMVCDLSSLGFSPQFLGVTLEPFQMLEVVPVADPRLGAIWRAGHHNLLLT